MQMQRVVGLLLVFVLVTQALAGGTLRIPLVASKLKSEDPPLSHFAASLGGVTKPTFKNNGMMSYTTQISIGTPPQKFMISLDLTYSDSLIAGINCETASCKDRKLFNQKKSSTFKLMPNIKANNSVVGSDKITIGDTTINDFTFSVASVFNFPYKNSPVSGILGLANNSYSKMGSDNLLTSLVNMQTINQSLFSIYLDPQANSENSFVLFGGMDESKYSGAIHWRPVTSNRFWSVRLVSITLDGTRVYYCNNPCRAVFSTVDPYIYGPPVSVRQVNKALNIYKNCSNYYTRPRLVFHLGPHFLSIPRSSYISRVGDECESLLQEGSVLRQNWVLGNLFLRSYYTVFDADNRRIGWGALEPTVLTN